MIGGYEMLCCTFLTKKEIIKSRNLLLNEDIKNGIISKLDKEFSEFGVSGGMSKILKAGISSLDITKRFKIKSITNEKGESGVGVYVFLNDGISKLNSSYYNNFEKLQERIDLLLLNGYTLQD